MSSVRKIFTKMTSNYSNIDEVKLHKLGNNAVKILEDIGLGVLTGIITLPIEYLLVLSELLLVYLLELSNMPIQNDAVTARVEQAMCEDESFKPLLQAICEELIFRGLLRPCIEKILETVAGQSKIAKYGSSIISSGLFAAAHIYGSTSARFFSALSYDWLKDRTNSLIAPIAAHVSSDSIASFIRCSK